MATTDTPARDSEEQNRWTAGLSAMIKELRETSDGKDAALIAARIAQFRRSFVGDPTKVLRL